MQLFKRELYLKKIRGFYHDTQTIKVLTGVRRCGKSCMLLMIQEELLAQGVPSNNCISLNLDQREYLKIKTPEALASLLDLKVQTADPGIKYIFIDEIQNVKNYEEIINAFREEGSYSIFITGSNSYLLSGELATKLTGRYLEFEIYTLTFAEYLGMKKLYQKTIDPNPMAEFTHYILEGGFPQTVFYDSLQDKRTYVTNVVQEIFEKDIKQRVKIRHPSVFNQLRDYIINNFGATTSISSIHRYFTKTEKIAIKRETIQRYIQILVDAKILYPCLRFDLKSRKSLAGEQKYYLSDLSFYFSLNTDNRINYGPVLENIVFFYAKSMGYQISVGRIGKLECDFILRNSELDYFYVQIAQTIADPATEDREYRPLEKIRDAYPKYVMTLDYLLQKRNGIKHVNLIDFLQKQKEF